MRLALQVVGMLGEALCVADVGFDLIVAQCRQAGRHVRGPLGTLIFLPQRVDLIAPPVLAADGIADQRGVSAACALGRNTRRWPSASAAEKPASDRPWAPSAIPMIRDPGDQCGRGPDTQGRSSHRAEPISRSRYDNALCESFFAILECELLARRRFASHAEARMATFTFSETWYNPARLHSALGYRSPSTYEEEQQAATAGP